MNSHQERGKYAEVENARTASCKAPSDVVREKAKAPKLDFCEKVSVYFHWFAIGLQDKLLDKEPPNVYLPLYIFVCIEMVNQ